MAHKRTKNKRRRLYFWDRNYWLGNGKGTNNTPMCEKCHRRYTIIPNRCPKCGCRRIY